MTAFTAITAGPLERFGIAAARGRAGDTDLPSVPLHKASTFTSWAHTGTLSARLTRFAATGVITSLVQFGIFFLLYDLGDQVANLVGATISSVLANEMHRRLTFRAGGRVTWLAAQWEGGALSAVALASTSLALAFLDDVVSGGWWAGALVVLAVNAAVGLTRFALLRLWVFSDPAERGPRARAAAAHSGY